MEVKLNQSDVNMLNQCLHINLKAKGLNGYQATTIMLGKLNNSKEEGTYEFAPQEVKVVNEILDTVLKATGMENRKAINHLADLFEVPEEEEEKEEPKDEGEEESDK